MRNVSKLLLILAVFGLAAYITTRYDFFGLKERTRPRPPPPLERAGRGLPADVRTRLLAASDFKVARLLLATIEEHRGTPAERELRRLYDRRMKTAGLNAEEQVESILEEYRYPEAAALAERYLRAWRGTRTGREVEALLESMRREQAEQVRSRKEEADALVKEERYEAALEALELDDWKLEPGYEQALQEHRLEVERIRRTSSYTPTKPAQIVGSRPPPAAVGSAPSPPALPGYPHPDVKRLRDARAALGKALALFKTRKYQAAARALLEMIEYYPDLEYVKSRREGVEAMSALARHKTMGVAGLFHATTARRKGKRVRLTYTFKTSREHLDWEELPTVPHAGTGRFEPARDGVRGTGVMSYCHRAFFKPDVAIRCLSTPQTPRSHGVAFCEKDNETRQLILLATNHWFTEGENYVKKRPGHSLLMIGKGTNNDVPVDAPEIGFVFKGGSKTRPAPPPGGEISLSFRFRGDEIVGAVAYKTESCTLRFHAHGDDGRGLVKARPTLFVVEAGVAFREVVIEGVLHPEYERTRIRELLNAVTTLE